MSFNQQAKIKKQQVGPNTPQSVEFAHYTNLEESEQKIVFRDKWPIPLASTNLVNHNADPSLHFGASIPNFILKPEPIEYDHTPTKFEQMEVRDPLFTYDFICSHLLVS